MALNLSAKLIYDHNLFEKKFLQNRALGIFVAESCAKRMDKFVPKQSGMLAQSYTTEPFRVTYNQPYAHYQYVGVNLNHSEKGQHPLATSYWDKAMWNVDSEVVTREITNYLRRP